MILVSLKHCKNDFQRTNSALLYKKRDNEIWNAKEGDLEQRLPNTKLILHDGDGMGKWKSTRMQRSVPGNVAAFLAFLILIRDISGWGLKGSSGLGYKVFLLWPVSAPQKGLLGRYMKPDAGFLGQAPEGAGWLAGCTALNVQLTSSR